MTKPRCPKCETELHEEFGMITCSGCGSVLFIDFEGQAQLAAGEADSADGTFHTAEAADFAPIETDFSLGPEALAPQNETPQGPLDISDYANSEASQAKEGPLTYTLYIEGLDSKELRDSLREAIGESRFGWDSQALMASVSEGKIVLKAVEPVKASVLVNRLKRLPLKIWWEQNVITDSKH